MLYTESRLGRYVSWVLRHSEEELKKLKANTHGEVLLVDLLSELKKTKFKGITFGNLLDLIKTDEKGRFNLFKLENGEEVKVDLNNKKEYSQVLKELNELKGTVYVSAFTGHSVPWVSPKLKKSENVPKSLYHGTTEKAWESIQKDKLLKFGSRHNVHLTSTLDVAKERGPVVLEVNTAKAIKDGWEFLVSSNPKEDYYFPQKGNEKSLPLEFIDFIILYPKGESSGKRFTLTTH